MGHTGPPRASARAATRRRINDQVSDFVPIRNATRKNVDPNILKGCRRGLYARIDHRRAVSRLRPPVRLRDILPGTAEIRRHGVPVVCARSDIQNIGASRARGPAVAQFSVLREPKGSGLGGVGN